MGLVGAGDTTAMSSLDCRIGVAWDMELVGTGDTSAWCAAGGVMRGN